MTLYVKKPIPVEAIQFTLENWQEVNKFIGDTFVAADLSDSGIGYLTIKTLEGNMTARLGAYIIRGVRGEIYSCDKDIFEETYEEVTDV